MGVRVFEVRFNPDGKELTLSRNKVVILRVEGRSTEEGLEEAFKDILLGCSEIIAVIPVSMRYQFFIIAKV